LKWKVESSGPQKGNKFLARLFCSGIMYEVKQKINIHDEHEEWKQPQPQWQYYVLATTTLLYVVVLTRPSSTAISNNSSACASRCFFAPSWRHNALRDMVMLCVWINKQKNYPDKSLLGFFSSLSSSSHF
jgi:hypothetical protein